MNVNRPYLSVVAVSRNDNHGKDLLKRMQIFCEAFLAQCRRHGLAAELILVEWNPPSDRPKLATALKWPEQSGPCVLRIVEVPPEVHAKYACSGQLPLFQMIGKNVGIARLEASMCCARTSTSCFRTSSFSSSLRSSSPGGTSIASIDGTWTRTCRSALP